MNLGPLRIKFIWGAGKVIQARWRFGLFGFYEHAKGYHRSGLVFSVRGLLVLGLILAVLAYVGAATALFFWLDRGRHNYVTYTDTLLWPLRREAIREKRGQAYIEEGIADLKSQHWSEAEMKLRVGLLRQPQALRARLALAEFYLLAQRRPQALRVLAEGLEVTPGYPGRRYLHTYFTVALQGEDFALVRTAAGRYLAAAGEPAAKERAWLRQQQLQAMLAEKNAAAVLDLLRDLPAEAYYEEVRVLALLDLGRAAEAVAQLENWRARSGATGQILRLLVRAGREAGEPERMEAALADLRRLTPSDPAPYAYGIVQRALAGCRTAAESGLDDYFLRFGANARSLLPLAQPLADIGAVDLLQEFIRRLAEQGHDRRPALLLLAQAQLKVGNWEAARATVAQLRTLGSPDNAGYSAALELVGLLATVAADPAEGPQVQLLDYVGRQMYPLRTYRTVIETLLKAGRNQLALEVAIRGERHYAGNAALLALKAGAQAALAAAQAEAAARTAGAPAGRNNAGADSLLAEGGFFDRVDAAMSAARWEEAQTMVREVQRAKPGWLGTRQADVYQRQLRIAHATRESLELMLAARLLQDGTTARAQLVVDYATELQGQGATADAVLLLREVLRKIPHHARARQLLEEWTKRPEPPARPVAAPPEAGADARPQAVPAGETPRPPSGG